MIMRQLLIVWRVAMKSFGFNYRLAPMHSSHSGTSINGQIKYHTWRYHRNVALRLKLATKSEIETFSLLNC